MTETIKSIELIKGIKNRWSPRAFDDKMIESHKLDLIFEAARRAPSSMNEQPWRFILGKKGDVIYSKLLDALNTSNSIWAKNAPVLIGIIAKTHFDYKVRENKHAWYDTGQAVANLMVQATELDLYGHQMGGFDKGKLLSNIELEDYMEPIAILALGYRGDPESLSEDLKARELAERRRKPISELIVSKN